MRRLAALVLAHALIVPSAAVRSLHVHAYLDHDHPEHHHGPAIHEHPHSAVVEAHRAPVAEGHHTPAFEAAPCDPGLHAVTIAMRCAWVLQVHVDVAELPGPTIVVAPAPIRSAVPVADLRVHGPPFDTRSPSRAPPLTPHA